MCDKCDEEDQDLMEKADNLETENAKLRQQVKELQDNPLIEIRPDGKVRGHNCAGCEGLERELQAALLQIDDLKTELLLKSNAKIVSDNQALETYEQLQDALRLVRELQEIVVLCVQQGGLSFHVEGGKCPEDDTCDCPDALRVNKAMKGYTAKPNDDCGHNYNDPARECPTCAVKRNDPAPIVAPWKEHWLRAARFLKSWDAGSGNFSEGWHEAANKLEERISLVDREPYTH